MHFIYVAEGHGSLIKIGLTSCPKKRAKALRAEFKREGEVLKRVRILPGMHAGYGCESSVIGQLRKVASKSIRREWFVGIAAEHAYRIAREKVMEVRRLQLARPSLWLAK